MFGHRYFGARFFGPRYFGPAGGDGPGPEPEPGANLIVRISHNRRGRR